MCRPGGSELDHKALSLARVAHQLHQTLSGLGSNFVPTLSQRRQYPSTNTLRLPWFAALIAIATISTGAPATTAESTRADTLALRYFFDFARAGRRFDGAGFDLDLRFVADDFAFFWPATALRKRASRSNSAGGAMPSNSSIE